MGIAIALAVVLFGSLIIQLVVLRQIASDRELADMYLLATGERLAEERERA